MSTEKERREEIETFFLSEAKQALNPWKCIQKDGRDEWTNTFPFNVPALEHVHTFKKMLEEADIPLEHVTIESGENRKFEEGSRLMKVTFPANTYFNFVSYISAARRKPPDNTTGSPNSFPEP